MGDSKELKEILQKGSHLLEHEDVTNIFNIFVKEHKGKTILDLKISISTFISEYKFDEDEYVTHRIYALYRNFVYSSKVN